MDFDDNSSDSSESGGGWSRHVDESSGRVYWYHSGEMRSQWTCPPELESAEQEVPPPPTASSSNTRTPENEEEQDDAGTDKVEVTEVAPARAQGMLLNGSYTVRPTYAGASFRRQDIPEADKIRKKHIDQMVKQYHAMGQLVKQLQVNQAKQERDWIQQQHIQDMLLHQKQQQQQQQQHLQMDPTNRTIPPTALPSLPFWKAEKGLPPPSISELAETDYAIIPVADPSPPTQQNIILPSPLSTATQRNITVPASIPHHS
eukprot:TRINITY_DN20213_c3_g1_i1.p1 TRINITY_DN20213_c3_g1~~TRINITY_DN20213_c3_g1_i1.p1  ORF type:complete len:259 (+),score=72.04 TRINITY_DN20213_c3_g1_i1:73-849(+)